MADSGTIHHLAAAPSSVAPFARTYDEAMSLMIEARNYLAFGEPAEREALAPIDRLTVSCETLRLTSRLTQVMAWLLVQKAVQAGELTWIEATGEAHRLAGHTVCSDVTQSENALLPRALKSLLDRSYALYQRIARLDSQICARALSQASGGRAGPILVAGGRPAATAG